jgi:hypothetical protein
VRDHPPDARFAARYEKFRRMGREGQAFVDDAPRPIEPVEPIERAAPGSE